MFDPPPRDHGFDRPPDALAARISALLDKAESTPYPAEAETFLAKAQELMARHAIDEAMLAGARQGHDEITTMDLLVANPYATAKSVLLGAVANANRCRVVSVDAPGGRQRCTVVGHRTDLDHLRALYLSLSHQAVRAMLEATPPPGTGVRRFRHSFLLSYATRIEERLREAGRVAEADAQDAQLHHPGGRSVTLVMASRQAKVDREFSERFPQVRTRRVSSSSGAGHVEGRRAADRSALGGRGVGAGGGALPRG
jgi:hypothetical protein